MTFEPGVELSSPEPLSFSKVTKNEERTTLNHHAPDVLLVQQEPQLAQSLKFLYGVSGATLQLPSLALLAIVNDRAQIPPAYLPAYGAISFLPWSLKPIYASMTNIHLPYYDYLLALFLVANGLSYLGTALWIPQNGVVQCFVWGFARGLFSAWPEFMLDQSLIAQAHAWACFPANSNHSYQALSSQFQSQAATCRNLGSLVASICTFGVFAWRQERHDDNALSDAVVLALCLSTAILNWTASLVVMVGIKANSTKVQSSPITNNNNEESGNGKQQQQQVASLLGCQQQKQKSGRSYDALATAEEQDGDESPLSDSAPLPTTLPLDIREESFSSSDPTPYRRRTLQERSDIAMIVILQCLLIVAALQHLIISISSPGVWISLIVFLGACLLVTVIVSSSCCHGPRQSVNEVYSTTSTAVIPPRRLGLYLILRHAVPIAGMLMYSYIYTIFATEPLFLQILMIVESAVSAAATWVYGRFFAKSFHSGWSMIGLIAILSIVASLVSLLDLIVVHTVNRRLGNMGSDDNKDNGASIVDAKLRCLVFLVSIVTYFMGELGFMPSVVLATANVVSPQHEDGACDPQADLGNGPAEMDGIVQTRAPSERPVYDQGMQYASFVSCIDFGAQVGDWISVPIVAALGITRENNWAHLDHFIVICALARMASIGFLWLIRPPDRQLLPACQT